jgi:NADPH:quinone reductase-like Zn-dependent oxidoreductase
MGDLLNLALLKPNISSVLRTLKPYHVVRLRAYRPRPAINDVAINDFISSWKASRVPAGLVYSELCEHVLAWSEQASAEIDNPMPFAFLEYSIIEPEYGSQESPDNIASSSLQFDVVEGIYNPEFRLINEGADGVPETIMFNLFEIGGNVDMEQGFVMNWVPRADFRAHEEGFFSAVLHRRIRRESQFAAFNRAEVRNAASYAKEIERFEKAFPREERRGLESPKEVRGRPPVRSYLGLFRIKAAIGPLVIEKNTKLMHSVRIHGFGDPSVLKQEQVPLPEPGPGQIRIKVKSSAVNALDIKMRSGEVSKIFPAWFPDTLGYSVAGIVDAVGSGVAQRQVGQEVYGINHPVQRGGYAEYVVGIAQNYARKPDNIDFHVAASIPSVFATAYGALFGRVPLKAGQRILIHGGSGAVGSFAVQLAKRAGAYVIATASAHNLGRLFELGASEVIDYKNEKFEEKVSDIDFVLDTVGGETRDRSWLVLKEGGVLATLVPPLPDEKMAALKKVTAFLVHGHSNIGEILPKLTDMIEQGELSPPAVVKKYALANAAQAHSDFAASAGSRIVLQVS